MKQTATQTTEFDVVIVGAGIAGTALAAALSGQGLRLALVEAQPAPGRDELAAAQTKGFDPRVSALTPRSRVLLEQVGAWGDIAAARLCAYQHMSVWDAQGTGSIDFDCAEVGQQALGYIVENRVIVDALLNVVGGARDVTLLCPARLVECDMQPDGGAQLQLDDGQSLSAALVVAADGALSRLRQLLEFETREWDYGHRAIVATLAVEQAHEETAWQRFLPTGPLAFLPLPDLNGSHHCSIVWSVSEEVADELLALDDAAFCQRVGEAFEHRLGRVCEASPRFAFPLRQRHAIDYVRPGVALVGDAAHTIHPLAGQGINLGLADVQALAEEVLGAARRGAGLGAQATLARYQRRRKGENLAMMAAMDGFKRLFEHPGLPVRWLRNAGLRAVGQMGPLKQTLMRQAMGLSDGPREP